MVLRNLLEKLPREKEQINRMVEDLTAKAHREEI